MTTSILSTIHPSPALARDVADGLRAAKVATWTREEHVGQRPTPEGNRYVPGWVCRTLTGRRVGFVVRNEWWCDSPSYRMPPRSKRGRSSHAPCRDDADGDTCPCLACETTRLSS